MQKCVFKSEKSEKRIFEPCCVSLAVQLWVALALSVDCSSTRWQLRGGWVWILDPRPHWLQDVFRDQVQRVLQTQRNERRNWRQKNGRRSTTGNHQMPPAIWNNFFIYFMRSVLWHCWLGVRKSIRPVKIEWRQRTKIIRPLINVFIMKK